MTTTYSTCDIVILIRKDPDMQPTIYAQDLSVLNAGLTEDISKLIASKMDPKYIRDFEGMDKFTKWLLEQGAVVDNCWIVGEE